MQTDVQTERHMMKLIFDFRNFANDPQNEWRKSTRKDNGSGGKKIIITLLTGRKRK
jgi:hypothetical protein